MALLHGILFVAILVDFVVAEVPSVPLAELVFAQYNSDWQRRNSTWLNPGINEDFCFISHGCWGGEAPQKSAQKDVADTIAKLIDNAPNLLGAEVRFIVAAGDNFYPRGVRNYRDTRFYTTFEQFYTVETPARRVPWLVALGNHDYVRNFWAQVNYTYMGPKEETVFAREWAPVAHGASVTGRWYLPHPYYAVKVSGDMVVIIIDTLLLHRCADAGAGSPRCWDGGRQQAVVEDWLLRKYADVRHKVVVGHYPVISNGPHKNFQWLQDWLIPLMRKSCASIYIHADNHYLQVSKDGQQYYANSGGGAGLNLHVTRKFDSWVHPQSVFHEVSFGVMVHCKKGGRFRHTVLDVHGKERFAFESWAGEEGGAALQQCLGQLHGETKDPVQRRQEPLPSLHDYPHASDGLWAADLAIALFPLSLLAAVAMFIWMRRSNPRTRRR